MNRESCFGISGRGQEWTRNEPPTAEAGGAVEHRWQRRTRWDMAVLAGLAASLAIVSCDETATQPSPEAEVSPPPQFDISEEERQLAEQEQGGQPVTEAGQTQLHGREQEPGHPRDPHAVADEVIVLQDKPGIQQYQETFVSAGKEFSVNPNYLAAIAWIESNGGRDTGPSPKGAEGYMQIMPATARNTLALTKLNHYNPADDENSIWVAAATLSVMKQQLDESLGSISAAAVPHDVLLVSYNAGPGRAEQYVKAGRDSVVLPQETRDYLVAAEEILERADS